MICHIKKKKNNESLNNKGAALITVIIVLLFISILCTLVLYISSVNYRMKKADYLNKVSFYSSEIALEKMQSNLVQPVSISLNYALQITNTNYYRYSDVNSRKAGFYSVFFDEFIKTLERQCSTTYDPNDSNYLFAKQVLNNLTGVPISNIFSGTDAAYYSSNGDMFVETLARNGKLPGIDGAAVTYIVLPTYDTNNNNDYLEEFISLELIDPDTLLAYDDDHIRVVFHDLYVVTVENNTMSVVRTDVAIQLPPVDWAGGTGTSGNLSFNANEMIFYVNWQKR